MKLTKEQRETLKEYFGRLGLNRHEKAELFWFIRHGCNPNVPLMILGEPTTGKTMLTAILRHFGVCVYSPHESPMITLKKRLTLSEEECQYMRETLVRLGIREKY